MRRSIVAILFSSSVVFSANVFVKGDTHGNGGDVVRCESNGKVTNQVLDFYEAEHSTPPLVLELGPGTDAVSKVLYALERIRTLNPKRFAYYQQEAMQFYSRVDRWIESGPPLEDIDDAGALKLAPECQLVQAAIHRKQFHPSIKPYLIDKRVWDKLSETDRAGLILHEIIYGEMYQLGQDTSVKARRFNALLSTVSFEKISVGDYEALEKDLFKVIYPPIFRAQEFDLNTNAELPFVIELKTLLLHPVETPLRWDTLEPLPKWMAIKDGIFSGVPPKAALGTIVEINLVVRDDRNGAIAKLRVRVR